MRKYFNTSLVGYSLFLKTREEFNDETMRSTTFIEFTKYNLKSPKQNKQKAQRFCLVLFRLPGPLPVYQWNYENYSREISAPE